MAKRRLHTKRQKMKTDSLLLQLRLRWWAQRISLKSDAKSNTKKRAHTSSPAEEAAPSDLAALCVLDVTFTTRYGALTNICARAPLALNKPLQNLRSHTRSYWRKSPLAVRSRSRPVEFADLTNWPSERSEWRFYASSGPKLNLNPSKE